MQIGLPVAADIVPALVGWRAANPSLDRFFYECPEPHEALRRFGLTLWAKGGAEAAIDVFKAALALAPEDLALWNDLAGAFYGAGRHEEARIAQRHSIDKDAAQPQAWLLLAAIESQCGSGADAETYYLTALQLDPRSHAASLGIGVLCFQQRRVDEAITYLRRSIADGGHTLGLYVCLGQALFLAGDISGAVSALTVATSFAPKDSTIVQKLAKLRLIETAIRSSGEDAISVYRDIAGRDAEDIEAVTDTAFHFLSGYGYREAAIKLARARLARNPDDFMQRYLLAALLQDPITRAPDDYIVAYFDRFADTFESKLVDTLRYRVPEDLHALLVKHGRGFARIVDLGCGTGLAAPWLRSLGASLVGVDLSSRMLQKAAERQLYDRLIEAEIGSFLKASDETFDLAVAADVLIYFGDLTPIFDSVARVIAPGGLVAFSLETTTVADFLVLPSGRFAHSKTYIQTVAEKNFVILDIKDTTIRLEANQPLAGVLVVMQRR